MSRYVSIMLLVACLLLGMYFAMQLISPAWLKDVPAVGSGRFLSAAVGVTLLIADVLLPVPSSLIMVSNGVLFGPVLGASLSLLGSMGAALTAYWLGRVGAPVVARLVNSRDMRSAQQLFERFGPSAIALSRPLPIVAETLALFAGASRMPLRPFLGSALLGNTPVCISYAFAGAAAEHYVGGAAILFAAALIVAGIFYWIAQRVRTP